MLATILLTSLFIPAAGAEPPPSPDFRAYEAARQKADRTADAQVKLALWCEAHGLGAERLKHLTMATLLDPSHAAARGLLGLVSYGGRRQRPEDVSRNARDEPAREALERE